MAATALHRPTAEVRRLRSELAATYQELAELRRLLAEYLAANPGLAVGLDLARLWSRQAYERGRAYGAEAGRLEIVAELKATDRELKAAFDLEIKRWGPGGRACFGKPRLGDFAGTETLQEGRPG